MQILSSSLHQLHPRAEKTAAAAVSATNAASMELALMPTVNNNGNINNNNNNNNKKRERFNNDGPYRNEDVREWSTVDEDTGMRERARVQTDKWRNDTADASQSYGKMVDSRERNSVDGSLVQKARRQVEIFQSQANNSGRCFQVVKASQWKSSRATDNNQLDLPIAKYNNLVKIGAMNSGDPFGFWHPSLLDSASDLEHLTNLCRQLHHEALRNSSQLWSLRSGSANFDDFIPATRNTNNNNNNNNHHNTIPIVRNIAVSAARSPDQSARLLDRSNSHDDLSNLVIDFSDDNFNRDAFFRRSLQVPRFDIDEIIDREFANDRRDVRNDGLRDYNYRDDGHDNSNNNNNNNNSRNYQPSGSIAERARQFEQRERYGTRREEQAQQEEPEETTAREDTSTIFHRGRRINEEDEKVFTPISENDFVKNDPKHPSKFERNGSRSGNGQKQHDDTSLPKWSHPQFVDDRLDETDNTAYNRRSSSPVQRGLPTNTPPTSRKVSNNKTVVHLRNAASPTSPDTPPTRCVNITAVGGQPKSSSSSSSSSVSSSSSSSVIDGNNYYRDGNNKENNNNSNNNNSNTNNNSNNNGQMTSGTVTKPVKRVEFCKTEIHFAPDSGKVNIVETDGKPPPTNRYRRRRKNHSNANSGFFNSQKSNMPLVHFGDTSYERYIFGGKAMPVAANDHCSSVKEEIATEDKRNNRLIIRDEGDRRTSPEKSFFNYDNDRSNVKNYDEDGSNSNFDKAMTDGASKSRGTHTTTVNLTINDGDDNGAYKIIEENPARPLSPVHLRSFSPTHASLHLRSYSSPPMQQQQQQQQEQHQQYHHHEPIQSRRSPSPLFANESPSPRRRRSPSPPQPIIRVTRATSPIVRNRSPSPFADRSRSPAFMAPLNRSVSPAHLESHVRTKTPPPPLIPELQQSSSPTSLREQSKDGCRTRTVIIHNEPPPTTILRSVLRNSRSRSRSPGRQTSVVTDHRVAKSGPTYENVFANGVNEDVIVYENCGSPVRMDIKFADAKSKLRKRWSRDTRSSAAKKISPKSASSTKSATQPSKEKTATIKSVTIDPKTNSKSSQSQEGTGKKEKVKVAKAEKKIGGRGISAVREHKLVGSGNGSTFRSKKPAVEVVYETAVYNMKNENLSKPVMKRTEVIRAPRLINELICGSKLKRSTDNKKNSIKSNNTSHRVARCK